MTKWAEDPLVEPTMGTWQSTIGVLVGAVGILAPAAIITLVWGQRSPLAKFLLPLSTGATVGLWCRARQKDQLSSWLKASFPGLNVGPVSSLWGEGTLLCALINSAVPGACPHPHLHRGQSLSHGQALAYKYLQVPPAFTEDELLSKPLTVHLENRLIQYAFDVKQAIRRLEDNRSRFVDRIDCESGYLARGMGLVAARHGQTASFNVYSVEAAGLADLIISIRGPYGTAGSITVPAFQRETTRTKLLRRLSIDLLGMSPVPRVEPKGDIVIKVLVDREKTSVSYVPLHEGIHEICVVSNGSHIIGSPYSICVESGGEVEQKSKRRIRKLVKTKKVLSRCILVAGQQIEVDAEGRPSQPEDRKDEAPKKAPKKPDNDRAKLATIEELALIEEADSIKSLKNLVNAASRKEVEEVAQVETLALERSSSVCSVHTAKEDPPRVEVQEALPNLSDCLETPQIQTPVQTPVDTPFLSVKERKNLLLSHIDSNTNGTISPPTPVRRRLLVETKVARSETSNGQETRNESFSVGSVRDKRQFFEAKCTQNYPPLRPFRASSTIRQSDINNNDRQQVGEDKVCLAPTPDPIYADDGNENEPVQVLTVEQRKRLLLKESTAARASEVAEFVSENFPSSDNKIKDKLSETKEEDEGIVRAKILNGAVKSQHPFMSDTPIEPIFRSKQRFEQAKKYFERLERLSGDSTRESINNFGAARVVDRFKIHSLFQDILGDGTDSLRGVPNKRAVVASLASIARDETTSPAVHCGSEEIELDLKLFVRRTKVKTKHRPSIHIFC